MKANYPGTCVVCGNRFPAGTEIEWDSRTRTTRHSSCTPFVAPANAWWVAIGQGYGGVPFTVGEILKNTEKGADKPPYLIVLHATKQYFREDGMSLGVGDERGYVYRACVRAATDEESALFHVGEARAQAKIDAKMAVTRIAREIQRDGTYVAHETPMPTGEHVLDDENIYGSGSLFVIAADGVWYLEANMMDGDNWSENNVAGRYRGWFTDKLEQAERLRAAIAVLAEK